MAATVVAFVFDAISYGLFLVFWLKLYPILLTQTLDLSVPGAAGQGVSISPHLHSLDPLVYITRFFAWNNSLLLRLALMGAWSTVKGLRGSEAATSRNLLFLALAIGCVTGMVLTVHQGLGWGYRYMHGYIRPFCLLAGWGWAKLCTPSPSLRPVFLSCGLAVLFMAAQAVMIHRFVTPYAQAHASAVARSADVVLIDARGSAFGQDIVRIHGERIHKPVILSLAYLDTNVVRQLCQDHKVAMFDRIDFARVGVMEARIEHSATTERIDAIRNYLRKSDCIPLSKHVR